MKKPKLYVIRPMEQIKRYLLLIKDPIRFAELEGGLKGINILLATVNILLVVGFSLCGISEMSLIKRILGWGISVILFIGYSWLLIRIGKGRVQIYGMINMSFYIHVIYILINSSVDNKALHLSVYILGHIYTMLLQVVLLKYVFKCELERIRIIFYIEVGIIIIGFLNQMMIYLGEQILYTSKILHYQLLG